MKNIFKESLRDILYDTLRTKKLISYEEVEQIATKGGWKPETATRRFRAEDGSIPCVKLNLKKKRIVGSERWYFLRWAGSRTVINRL